MTEFRVFIYGDGLVLPLVVPIKCKTQSLVDRLQRLFAEDLAATRAEVWDGPRMIMQIGPSGMAALADLADLADDEAGPLVSETRH